MVSPTSNHSLKLFIRRTFPTPRETVFKAWTEPEHLTKWFSPSNEIETFLVEIDLRPGGQYRFGFRENGDHITYINGTYREVEPPTRLVYTWTPEGPDPDADKETVVTVEFKEIDSGTEVVLVHERFPDGGMCQRHDQGWNGALDRLSNLI